MGTRVQEGADDGKEWFGTSRERGELESVNAALRPARDAPVRNQVIRHTTTYLPLAIAASLTAKAWPNSTTRARGVAHWRWACGIVALADRQLPGGGAAGG